MAETAEIYQFPDRRDDENTSGPAKAGRRPQVEDGYTRIANELLEQVMAAPLTLREMRVTMAVIRLTYGWNRKEARVTGGLLAQLTGMPATNASRTLSGLIARGVVIRRGGSRSPVSLNKDVSQWASRPDRHPPKTPQNTEIDQSDHVPTKQSQSDRVGHTEIDQNGHASKDKKDNTPSNEGERIGDRDQDPTPPEPKPNEKPSLPDCPHNEIIDLWAEIMPDKPQPTKNLWHGTDRARHLASRWKAGFTIRKGDTGEPLYTNREEGIAWWGRFFRFLRRSEFLMGDNRWFKLAWVAKRENFVKIMEMSYHDEVAQ